MKILAIIPVHNEEGNILNLIHEIEKLETKVDYIVVNDGSTDRTKNILVNNKINHVSHSINLGLSESIKTGFKYAHKRKYSYAIQIDGDGQHDPKYIKPLFEKAKKQKLDFIQGSRFVGKKKGFSLRMLGSWIISFAIFLTTRKWIMDPTNGMRLYDAKLMERFLSENSLYVEPDTIAYLIKDQYKYEEMYVHVRSRKEGKSYLTSFKAIFYMTSVMFSILMVQAFRPKKNKKINKKNKGGK